jgi:hypothetical protein
MLLGGAVEHAPPHLPDCKTRPRNSRECRLISETRGLTSLAGQVDAKNYSGLLKRREY